MTRTWSLALLLAAACGGAQKIPADARTTVLSLERLDCGGCGEELASKLKNEPGVYDARFDKRRAEVTVVASPRVDAVAEANRLRGKEGYAIAAGPGRGSYLEWSKPPEGADVATVAQDGADVPDLRTIAVPGKVTVVDFGAAWCEPCRKLDAHVMEILGARRDVAYRKLDVGDWDTPLARHYLADVPNLPYVVIFGRDGARLDAIPGLDLARVDRAIQKGAR